MRRLKNKRLREWGGQLLLLGLIGIGVSAWQQRGLLADAERAPMFELQALSGGLVQLAPIESETTVLYFFAPWCSICKLSMGNIDQLQGSATSVLAIALAYDSPEAVARLVDEIGLKTPVLLGTHALQQAYQIEMFPTYYVLDREKRILSKSVGYSTELGLRLRTL